MSLLDSTVEKSYSIAAEHFEALGVDADAAIERLLATPVSIHCWQGDDVGGFEGGSQAIGGGLAVTGAYPGSARTPDELRADFEQAMRLIPGAKRFNLHASYAETGGRRVERNELTAEHFQGWMDWAHAHGLGLDFNPTFFAHPLAEDGWTLAARDEGVRRFWMEHAVACRRIGAAMGARQGSPCVVNVWIPDGSKDTPIDRRGPRERLIAALDEIFSEELPDEQMLDAVECKLFGLGSESYVVGSHELYLGYAATRQKVLCLDAGHFHPTETIADKVSAVLQYVPRLLLHVSRGVRWDSDHVVILDDATRALAQEVVRGGYLDRTHLGLDFFDASINRVAAWVIGARAVEKALLEALLEPVDRWRKLEATDDRTARLAELEDFKSLPVGAVWDAYCLRAGAPLGFQWMPEIRKYEREVLSSRT
ncbi:MAG: L-rhamnose isomerase [Acidobacteria bacterium]|nr:L-rhamnose isomerase [Acidobacteriota bacterium]